jgi:hypoxanthine-guanine phosphoribosyltransferase
MSTATPALGETLVESASIRRRVRSVVGCGLDYAERYRNLADIRALHGV